MSTQRRKSEAVKKDETDTASTPSRTRQKRGSTSQTTVSSLVENIEESVQCNGLSTSSSKTSKSRTVSVLSSTEIGGQRRSARLSQIESQQSLQTLQTPEKKKKKNDDQKTPPKDKRKSSLNTIVEKNSEKSVNKRTSIKLKNVTDSSTQELVEKGEEGEEPVEKRSKRNICKPVQKEIAIHEGSSEDGKINESETERCSSVPSSRSSKKNSFKKIPDRELYSPDIDKSSIEIEKFRENETIEQIHKVLKRKKSVSSHLSSCVENSVTGEHVQEKEEARVTRSLPCKEEYIDADNDDSVNCDAQNKTQENESNIKSKRQDGLVAGNASVLDNGKSSTILKSPKLPSQNNTQPPPTDVAVKGNKPLKSNPSLNKEDLVLEYNRSITEKISLLKPKAFVGRSNTAFRKTVDDQNDGSGQEIDSDAESRRAIMESAQRRIEQNLSTSESDSRYFRGMNTPIAHSSKNDSSESESAPEVVSFANARQEAIETIKSAAEHVKREKQRLKERRKARLEMLKQQKEEKLIRLKEKMASQEDASCSSSEESGYEEEIRNARLKLKKKKAKSKSQRTEKENLDDPTGQVTVKPLSGVASDESSEEDFAAPQEAASLSSLSRVQIEMLKIASDTVQNAKMQKVGGSSRASEDKLKKKKSKSGKGDNMDKKDRGFKSLTSLDYIPLSTEGATKFMVVPLDTAMRAPKSLAEEAADFRQNMLYGSRINREPAKAVKAYKQKLTAARKRYHVR